jgi:hypothetical protein
MINLKKINVLQAKKPCSHHRKNLFNKKLRGGCQLIALTNNAGSAATTHVGDR